MVAVITSHLDFLLAHHTTPVLFRELMLRWPLPDFAAVSNQLIDRAVKLLVGRVGVVMHVLH